MAPVFLLPSRRLMPTPTTDVSVAKALCKPSQQLPAVSALLLVATTLASAVSRDGTLHSVTPSLAALPLHLRPQQDLPQQAELQKDPPTVEMAAIGSPTTGDGLSCLSSSLSPSLAFGLAPASGADATSAARIACTSSASTHTRDLAASSPVLVSMSTKLVSSTLPANSCPARHRPYTTRSPLRRRRSGLSASGRRSATSVDMFVRHHSSSLSLHGLTRRRYIFHGIGVWTFIHTCSQAILVAHFFSFGH
ncbi:hypothetical protein CaCOL14_010091 [Colletotrichum acutatum]